MWGRFASAKRIRQFWRSSPQENICFMKCRHLTCATGAHMQTVASLELFLYPMDRAEVLHAQSYNISGRRKNTPGENELVRSSGNSTVRPKLYTYVRA